MRAIHDRAALAAYHRALAQAFAARRCACGASACIVCVGVPPALDTHHCLPCAPWLGAGEMAVGGSVDRAGA
jgi:hypothetical protein